MWGFTVRGSWRSNITAIFWPFTLMAVPLCLSRSSDAQQEPWGPLCWVLAFFTASYQHLLWTPIHQGVPRAPSAGYGFPYHISTPTPSDLQLNWLVELNWVILSFDAHSIFEIECFHHQAEITVMQFRGHSLLVHQSISVLWEFFFSSSHFISQFPPTRFPLITAIRMCHFLPVHHLGMAFLAGFEGQNTT